jgi:hypothetical protein
LDKKEESERELIGEDAAVQEGGEIELIDYKP